MFSSVIDPAKELFRLLDVLRRRPPSQQTTWHELGQCIGISTDAVEYSIVLTAIRRRLAAFGTFAQNLEDDEFSPALRADVLAAASHIAQVFHPGNQASQWGAVQQQFVQPSDGMVLSSFSDIAIRHRVARLISSGEKSEIIKRLTATIAEAEQDTSLGWKAPLLVSALSDLVLAVKYIDFFGHQIALDQIDVTISKVSALAGTKGANLGNTVRAALFALKFAAECFVLPYATYDAYEHYDGYRLTHIHKVLDEQGATPALLPSPSLSLPPPNDKRDFGSSSTNVG